MRTDYRQNADITDLARNPRRETIADNALAIIIVLLLVVVGLAS